MGSTLGSFGSYDFSIEFTFTSTGGDITPDGNHGALFMRGNGAIGPSVYLLDDGEIEFRMLYSDKKNCPNAMPNSDSGAFSRDMKFERIGSTLILTIDGVEKCRDVMNAALTIDVSKFVDAPLRFGGNHQFSDTQNLRASLSNIKLNTQSLVQLNGVPIVFSVSSDPIYSATELSLVDDKHADIDASTLGNFGSSDFSIEFNFTSTGGDITPDGSYGALFIRSGQYGSPHTGPSAFLFDTGEILFRMRGNNGMDCLNALPNSDSGAYSRDMKFERIGSTLILTINGVEKCRHEMNPALTIDVSQFVDA